MPRHLISFDDGAMDHLGNGGVDSRQHAGAHRKFD